MQGFNMGRYVPPDLEGTLSFNQASGKGHALGHRARKLKTEGILTVRFECPFAIWCTHCNPETIIGQGVRFNAEKKKVGAYFSTPIWSFRFKHTVCGGSIEVRTDPKNAEYLVVEGGRRRDTGVDKLLDGEIDLAQTVSEEDKARLERDGGFGAIEKKVADKTLFTTQQERLNELVRSSERDWADPYEQSRKLRADFRVGRRKRQADEKSGNALKDRFGLEVEMLGALPEDGERVKFVDFGVSNEASSSAKPLFRQLDGTLPARFKANTSKKLDKKQSLQSQLASNTRIAADPFLREEHVWKPTAKRKRDDVEMGTAQNSTSKAAKVDGLSLVGYGSDSDST
ncbi:CWC16 protein [Exophiala viscosa]|uniref:CWC16 protein n=1 Tax=Exophiala viscosa TaxID=2486360 RepID=A0AAN6DQF5_9EURO|nr:CWC16 protein [Exophiala viscosa]